MPQGAVRSLWSTVPVSPRGWIRSFQSTASSPEKDRHMHTRRQRVPHRGEVDSSTDPDSSQGCRTSSLVHTAGVHTEVRQGGWGVRRGSGSLSLRGSGGLWTGCQNTP